MSLVTRTTNNARLFLEPSVADNHLHTEAADSGAPQITLWQQFLDNALDFNTGHIFRTDVVKTVLKARFGDALVDFVFQRYNLNDKPKLTQSDYRAILQGIAAHVKKTDLEARFQIVKNADSASPLAQFNSFNDLDETHVGMLLNDFIAPAKEIIEKQELQNRITAKKVISIVFGAFTALTGLTFVVVGALMITASFPVLLPMLLGVAVVAAGIGLLITTLYLYLKTKKDNPPYFKEVMDDRDFVKMSIASQSFRFDQDQKIAASEHLAHEAAYIDLTEGQIVPIREDNETIYAQVKRVINKEGFVCFLLAPLQEHRHLDNFPIWELYRGTHDMKSLRRLGEPYSAGHSSFKLHANELLEAKAAIVPAAATAVREIQVGHSLGGGDGERSAALTASKVAEAILAKKDPAALASLQGRVSVIPPVNMAVVAPYIEKVRQVAVRVWNAAGIAHQTNERFKAAVKVIEQHDPAAGCRFDISLCKVGGDPVQRAGQTSLGNGISQHPKVTRKVYKFQHGLEGFKGFFLNWGFLGKVRAHQIKNLNRATNGGKDPSFIHYDSTVQAAEVEQATGDHFSLGEGWQRTKWTVMSSLFGSSITDGKRYYKPEELAMC